MKKGDELELEIESFAFEGKGIAKVKGLEFGDKKFVIFVDSAYPGDILKVKITRSRKSYSEAKILDIIKPSKDRTDPKCKFFGTCGGCKQQNLLYDSQLYYKELQIKDTLERIGGLTDINIKLIIGSENKFYYRNKMEFSFSDKRWITNQEVSNGNVIKDKNFALGLHIPRIYDKVLDIDECFLQSELSNQILNFTRDYFKSKNASIYSTKSHEGFLRNLVVRQSYRTKDLMVNLVTSSYEENLIKTYADELLSNVPQITTIVNNINIKKSQVAVGDYEKVIYGDGFIYDKIGDFKFRISANSFFQTNTSQAEQLYKVIAEFSEASPNNIIYDLYSGTGTISVYMSNSAKKVFSFESIDSALEDAKTNCLINGIENINCIKADLNKSFLPLIQKNSILDPDIIILDPPRSGMNPKTVKDIIKLSPPKIVYVSCNPASQARDISILCKEGYKPECVQPVDMFPHTYHIENVALLIQT
ncbi:23S rRNA (uracil(1939)-C(5))-methyltransferase RlmD [Bacteroidota bacterium]